MTNLYNKTNNKQDSDNPIILSLENNDYVKELEQEDFEWHEVVTSNDNDNTYDIEDPDSEYFDN